MGTHFQMLFLTHNETRNDCLKWEFWQNFDGLLTDLLGYYDFKASIKKRLHSIFKEVGLFIFIVNFLKKNPFSNLVDLHYKDHVSVSVLLVCCDLYYYLLRAQKHKLKSKELKIQAWFGHNEIYPYFSNSIQSKWTLFDI